MAKEKRNLYEEVEFGNDYGYAMQVKRERRHSYMRFRKSGDWQLLERSVEVSE